VLVNTRTPLNIGAAARAMSNFGCTDLRVVNPYEPSFREARSAVGASAILGSARDFASVADAVADCTLAVGTTSASRRQLQHTLRRLDEGAKIIRRRLRQGRVAILFGSEKRGLSNADLSHCQWLLRIPTREEHGSMNLGQAVATCLYELARGGKPAKAAEKIKAASAGSLELITTLLIETLRSSGYLEARSDPAADEKVRRLVRRMNLTATDAELWLGMLRQVAWKIKASN
jgi:tRNA/rRNA methyltransferase